MIDGVYPLQIRSIWKDLSRNNASKVELYEPERRRTLVEHGEA